MDDWVDSIHFADGEGNFVDLKTSGLPADDDPDPDDEELAETPSYVVAILGFDPKGADYSE